MKIINRNMIKCKRIIGLLFLFFMGTLVSYGANRWSLASHTKTEWMKADGVVKISVMYFDDHGSDIVDYNSGLTDDGMIITFGNTRVQVTCNSKGGGLNVETLSGNNSCYTKSGGYEVGNKKWVDLFWKITQEDLNKELTISFNGKWWHRGATKDDHIEASTPVPTGMSRTPFIIPSPSTLKIDEYSSNKDAPAIKIDWKREGKADEDTLGDIVLLNSKNQEFGRVKGGTQKGTFYVPLTGNNSVSLNTAETFHLQQDYTCSKNTNLKYVSKSEDIVMQAYPQIAEFKGNFEPTDKAINLNWKLQNAPSVDYIVDDFEILEGKTENGKTINKSYSVAYQGGMTNYNFSIDVPEKTMATYTYTILRKLKKEDGVWRKTFDKSLPDLKVNTVHANVSKATAILDPTQRFATINWEIEGDAWSKNSKLSIIRQNVGLGTSDEIFSSTDEKFVKTEHVFEDKTVRLCNTYQYKLMVVPNSSYSPLPATYTDEIAPEEIGKIADLIASKGYYSNRVDLSWKTIGGFDSYSIERKLMDEPESQFKQILTQEAYKSSELYNISDETCEAGKVYTYRVKGIISCNGTKFSNILTDNGFRTPTGDIYGRVVFENGQGVDGAEVYLSTLDAIPGHSLQLDGSGYATINADSLLTDQTDKITIQAWVNPQKGISTKQSILNKQGMYELGINAAGQFFFKVGNDALNSVRTTSDVKFTEYVHVTGTYDGDSIILYLNGLKEVARKTDEGIQPNKNIIKIGEKYIGYIDEIRIWGKALSANEILRDYNRCLVGNEDSLLAYYNFNYMTLDEFYDMSNTSGNYHENHGHLGTGVKSSTKIPTNSQLGYRGVTSSDGSYAIRGIPYVGDGSTYSVIAQLGIHEFQPIQENRLIGPDNNSYTLNFTDLSSFEVSGKVVYDKGQYPVEGVSFKIDGVTALRNNGTIITTSDNGEFTIHVPVGTHEVKAELTNHKFANDGRICDHNGADLNYQDAVSERVLTDITTVRFIGRLAGGPIQEDYPYGHSLSKNNLSSDMYVYLKHSRSEDLVTKDSTVTVNHFLPSNKTQKDLNSNEVTYDPKGIKIYPNQKTGEFVADILPISYTVQVLARGHDAIPGDKTTLDASSSFGFQNSIYNYSDSILTNKNTRIIKNFSDTVKYQLAQKYIKRYEPTIRITQLNDYFEPTAYFGNDTLTQNNVKGDIIKVPIYDSNSKKYLFDRPVFQMNHTYNYLIEVFEAYKFFDSNKGEFTDEDDVPTENAKVEFTNKLAVAKTQNGVQVTTDSLGVGYYTFKAGEPELTTAKGLISAKAYIGSGENQTSVNWTPPFNQTGECFLLGVHMTGTDFVTAGPDKLITVLRDPPGSNSYAYLEKGTSFEISDAYTGSIKNEGTEDFTTGMKQQVFTITTVPTTGTGTAQGLVEAETNATWGISHEEEYEGTDEKKTTVTTTTRFQTSDSPDNVGPLADVFVGCGTNITFGNTENVMIIPKDTYNKALSQGIVFDQVYYDGPDWKMIKKTGLNSSTNFSTLFVYTRKHIEDRLIPQLINLRDSKITLPGEATEAELQQKADKDTTLNFYLSSVDKNNSLFSKESTYKHIHSAKVHAVVDTIEYLNQSIDAWYKHLRDNEEAEVKAVTFQNYSFTGSAGPIEYSESFGSSVSHESTFHITIGGKVANDWKLGAQGTVKFELEEQASTTHGGTFSTEAERSHTKGFVLAEDGSDYISVDVCREEGWTQNKEKYDTNRNGGEVSLGDLKEMNDTINYSAFVFRTRGGVTSCPYEGEFTTQYYDEGFLINEATMQVEVPKIGVENAFIKNVPSGETAKIKLLLNNNSEANEDVYYNLVLDESSNKDGAKLSIDGAPIGDGRTFLVPSGNTLEKTMEVGKGTVLNYDNLKLVLQSQCQDDITDTVSFSVHFIPSCSKITIDKPTDKWTYNTQLDTTLVNNLMKHYIDVAMSDFDVNYDDFDRLELRFKPSSESDKSWITLMKYYNDSTKYKKAIANGQVAKMIETDAMGKLNYRLFLDSYMDQNYDLCAVTVCNINNVEVENSSSIATGIKDMYNPRLFGAAQPANGILTVQDEIRLNFNEPIADGLLTKNDFQVTGIRNGSIDNKSASVQMDGLTSYMHSEFDRNWLGKDLTFEAWINADKAEDATLFAHGDNNNSMEFGITADNKLKVKIGSFTDVSIQSVPFDKGSWAHVALVYQANGHVSAYYNFKEYISDDNVGSYSGTGNFMIGRNRNSSDYYAGKINRVRIWDRARTQTDLKLNSELKLAGTETGLIAYYPMQEGKGTVAVDHARGSNMVLNACKWALPKGYSVYFDGSSYLKIPAGTIATTSDMDYTLEFWFKSETEEKNSVMACNGIGDAANNAENKFTVGFSNDTLYYSNNGIKHALNGKFNDNSWHHFLMTVSRTTAFAQIYMDGVMNTFFDADQLGGIGGSNIYLGALVYKASEGLTLKDVAENKFKGFIDEFRVWKLNETQTSIENFDNEKLNGDEMGLLAYYPFEYYLVHQGNKELESTLTDQLVNENIPVPAVAEKEGNVLLSEDQAPVKDKGAVENLKYEFVVNNDALIITLTEPEAKVENTIVNFTANKVFDKNGNKIISPITWSAYINKNQLRWEKPELDIQKKVYEPYEFKLDILNKGGKIQNYTISNQPSWLKVTPVNGSVDPIGTQSVEFKIDEGLSIGTYNEVIYLTNSNGVSEAFDLNVIVEGDKPDWAVDPAKYQFNMSVYSKLRFKGVYSSDKRDLIAAFQNGECIGVANCQYTSELDMWYAMLSVYNNKQTADNITFRMWDASTGVIYKANPSETITFENNAVYGTPVNPIVFDSEDYLFQKINLESGWNWLSFNLKSDDLKNINTILAKGKWSNGDQIKNMYHNDDYSARGKVWNGSLTKDEGGLNNFGRYLLKSSVAQTIDVSGTAIDPLTNPIRIKAGRWTEISYLPLTNLSVKTALSGYNANEGDIVKSNDGFAMFYRNTWVGSLSSMEVNKGYMLRNTSNQDKDLVYPSAAATVLGGHKVRSRVPQADNYSSNMSIIAVCDEMGDNDQLYAVIGNEQRGINNNIEVADKKCMFISVAGDPDMTNQYVHFVVEKENGDKIVASNILPYQANSLQGTIDAPVLINFDQNQTSVGIYPVPFNELMTVTAQPTNDAVMYIEITDLTGNLIYKSISQNVSANNLFSLNVDTRNFAEGVYMISIYENGKATVHKAIKSNF